ncbi:hypothetical protein FDA77_07010 [Clostridium botulinum]|uniref:hypothetical protein n=1 Tax=Clostridium botulinum TaxID=1491 RepID=UPI0013FC55EC|nr:hypothetical protein [Clostridium botulinum]MBY6886493.1 hypothetical protein [Clostridium botulinum]NFI45020.1 hypothetical protein [Clostridium botulinum]NFJ89657.1 hypothetical protein [Clostridium botulinum]HBJ2608379.1 hypothetical protein [Clostridium botulinum]HDI3118713.1 hypothetical protein [Clostridium botulinum]
MGNYIYFDWNVFQYLKSPRNEADRELKELLGRLRKKYQFPYSEAHMKDLSRNFNEKTKQYVEEDLEFIKNITRNVIIGIKNNEEFELVCKDPKTFFYKYIKDEQRKEKINIELSNLHGLQKIELDKLDKKQPLYNMIKDNDCIFSDELLHEYLNGQYKNVFNEKEPYNNMRNFISHLKEGIKENYNVLNQNQRNFLEGTELYLNSYEINNIDRLKNNFKEIYNSFIKTTNRSIENVPIGQQLTEAYTLLDTYLCFKEKITKSNKLSNIVRDSKHIYFAHRSKYYITEDNSTYEKTKFIYDAFNIKTKVCKINEFIRIFS